MNVYAPGWYFIAAIGRIIALALIPKMPMPQTSERTVTSHGRRDFADVIKVKDLNFILDCLDGLSVITLTLKRGEPIPAAVRDTRYKKKEGRFEV